MHAMTKRGWAAGLIMLALAAGAGAALLDVSYEGPLVLFGNGGRLQYEAGILGMSAPLVGLKLGATGHVAGANGPGAVRLSVPLDAEGVTASEGPEDLIVTGSIDVDGDGVAEYDEVLLTGAIRGFGYANGEDRTDRYDFHFQTTGGSLAGILGPELGMAVTSQNSTFGGRFTVAFDGSAEGTLGTISGAAAPQTPDYWLAHTGDWLLDGLTVGGTAYDQAALTDLLNGRLPGGLAGADEATVDLAKYVVATKLSILGGYRPDDATMRSLLDADALLAAHAPGAAVQGEAEADAADLKDDLLLALGGAGDGGAEGGGIVVADNAGGNAPAPAPAPAMGPAESADQILTVSGVKGGLVGHLGCGDGQLTSALHATDAYLVHGLDTSAADVTTARGYIQGLRNSPYGQVSVDTYDGTNLPYVDSLFTLLVVEEPESVSAAELQRVLAPGGKLVTWDGANWVVSYTKSPVTDPADPEYRDDWTHSMYDASNNAVSSDQLAGPPKHLQWVGRPRWSRHHDRMASLSAMVSAAGKLFYVMDEGSRADVILTPVWRLVARDAYSGAMLWKKSINHWHPHLWPFKSGATQLSRRLVADGLRVYCTMGLDAPVSAFDPETGLTLRTYEETAGTEEFVCTSNTLVCMTRQPHTLFPEFLPVHRNTASGRDRVCNWNKDTAWSWHSQDDQSIVAVNASTGDHLWTRAGISIMPMTLTADSDSVYYHNGTHVLRLDRATGAVVWTSEDAVSRKTHIPRSFGPTLVIYGDTVLFAGGDRSLYALEKTDGTTRWSGTDYHLHGGHFSPEDLVVIPVDVGGTPTPLAWSARIANSGDDGRVWGRSLLNGSLPAEGSFLPNYAWSAEYPSGWSPDYMHHRCHRARATKRYFLASWTGTEYINLEDQQWTIHHWARGGCSFGLIPANGLTYMPPHDCACYLQSKLRGLNALVAESPSRTLPGTLPERLESVASVADEANGPEDWPTYRHDNIRSGSVDSPVPAALRMAWQASLGGPLSALTVAAGRLYVCGVDAHRVYALSATTGDRLWSFTAGGRVDSPPTIHNGRVLFGSADGYVYCLEAATGNLAWRYRAAPMDWRCGGFEQVESLWPLHGSVLVRDNGGTPEVHCVAGRSMFLDGGLRYLRLNVNTGALISETVHNQYDPDNPANNLQTRMEGSKRMPVALPDILSCDDDYVYMRSQRFDFSGVRQHLARYAVSDQSGTGAHLFACNGFVDGSWFHRSFWIWGKDQLEGWGGWWQSPAHVMAAGRIISVDTNGGDQKFYGYCRDDVCWDKLTATPIEYHLYGRTASDSGYYEVGLPANPSGKALTVEAWVKTTAASGVVLSRGGSTHGYSLFIENGKPCFAIRSNSILFQATGDANVNTGAWVHLAGVLADDNTLTVYVNGQPAGSVAASGKLTGEPGNSMQLAADIDSAVANYSTPGTYRGAIDEAVVYYRALSQAEIQAHVATPGSISIDGATDPLLWFSGNAGDATDDSGHGHDGALVGGSVGVVPGMAGTALDFHDGDSWKYDVPFHVRGMVKAGSRLFVAGPRDVVDVDYAFDNFGNRLVQAKLRLQSVAAHGRRAGILRAIDGDTGNTLSEVSLNVVPVWDGMMAAGRRLYMATEDGRVICYGAR